LAGEAAAADTAIGRVPTREALDLDGLGLSDDQVELLLRVDRDNWREEAARIADDYAKFGDRLPPELAQEQRQLVERLA
jgi:phosphoenolpyruvate carboxykinase (GTP)